MKPFDQTKFLAGLAVCAALCATTSARADYSSTVLGLNPLAYYRLNETTPVPPADVAVNLGTLGASATGYYLSGATHPVPGGLPASTDGGAALFPDVGGNRVRIPWNPVLATSRPFTVEFWAAPGGAQSGDSSTMCPVAFTQFGNPPGDGAGYRAGWLFYENGTSGWTFRVYGTGNAGYNATANQNVNIGQWYHIVGVYDGANVTLYVNGQQGATAAAPLAHVPVPDTSIPLTIGARADGALGYFRYNGSVDEMVYYTNVLSPATILAHYQNGISQNPTQPYQQLVLAQNPAAYYRLGDPAFSPDPSTYPAAVNVGTLGSAVNGTYQPGSQTGAQTPFYSGFGAGNTGASFDGYYGSIAIGNPEELNFTNQVTVMAWIKPTSTAGIRDIVAHGYISSPNCQELYFRINAGAYQFGSCETAEGVAVANAANEDIGRWVFLAGTYDGTKWNLYRNGELLGSNAGPAGAGMVASLWSIGSRGDVTLGDGRFFEGSIDEVAIFNRGLTQQEIRNVFYSANAAPMIMRQPAVPLGTILAGAPVTLTVGAVGTPTLYYQWLKNGATMNAQTTSALSFSSTTTNDTGNYTVIVSNTFGTATSTVAALTITYPTAPASLLRTVGYPVYNPATKAATLTQVILEFSGPLAPSATDVSHYAISDGTPLSITSAQFTNLNQTVILTTFAQTAGSLYNVTLTGLTDGVGSPLANNTGQFRAWTQSSENGVRFDYYPGEEGSTVADLLNNMMYPNSPTLTTNLWGFDSRIVFPDDTHNRYGARMSTWFTPASSGKYQFSLRSDDAARVFINPAGPDAAGKVQIIDATACCLGWNAAQSVSGLIPLTAGVPYYLELLYQEGGGGDYGRLTVVPEGAAFPAEAALTIVDPASLQGPAIGYPYAPTEVGGPTVLTGPADATVQANHPVTFTVVASNPVGAPMTYQWLRGGISISGATGSSYTFIAAAGDTGARFSVRVSRFGSSVVSTQATLTVQGDTDIPAVAATHGSTLLNTVVIGFSQAMGNPATTSFSIAGFNTLNAVLDSTRTNVIVTLDKALTPGQTYTVNIQNVTDAGGQLLANATASVKAFVFSRGFLRFDFFGGLSDSVNTITELTGNPRYPNSPDWTGFIKGFDSRSLFPDDTHAGYGAHVMGWFSPATTDNFMFMIRSDDSSQLYFNQLGWDPSPSTLQLVAEQTACCNAFDTNGTLASMPMPLIGNNLYYIEGNLKEGGGGDYIQVAVRTETDPTPPANLLPITQNLVGYLADPVGSSVTIKQQPSSQQVVYNIAPLPSTLLDANFATGENGFTVTNYGTPPGPWSYNAVSGSWTNFGPDACVPAGPYASALNTPLLTITNDGAVVVTFSHRYSFEGGNWDMGQLRVSVNNGPFASVPSINFQQNGYNGSAVGTITPDLLNTAGWINAGFLNDSPGYGTGTFITSVAYLGAFKPGDKVKLQFVANWDDCSQGTPPNWEITTVKITLGGALPMIATLTTAAESVYLNQPSPYLTYFWQRNTQDGFVDIPGAYSSTLNQQIAFSESGTQFRCVVYGLGASATTAVSTVTVTMPIAYTRPTANTIKLTWPLPPPPSPLNTFVLEQAAAINGTWTQIDPATYQTTPNTVSVTVTVQPGANQFYRLRRTN